MFVGPERQQQRARATLEMSVEAVLKRLATKGEALQTPQAKVAASVAQGHEKRLAQRQRTLGVEQALQESTHKHDTLIEQRSALGPPRQRADRDLRTQTSMTCRTLRLENALMSFMTALLGPLSRKISRACLLPILFERSGVRRETASQGISWMNTPGLSVS
jgi:hypothetical protein